MDRAEPPESQASNRRNFYHNALSETEKAALESAAAVEGLQEEVAMLRVRLSTALKEKPGDLALALYGMNTLVRMVVAQYRLSPRASKELASNLALVLNNFADQLVPSDR